MKKPRIKLEESGVTLMTYEELIKSIKHGYEYAIIINNIEIGILSQSDISIICYVLNTKDERIHITDIEIKKQDIETFEIFEYKTLKQLLEENIIIKTL